jgi:4-hydroxy-tetrahydrodipicolinate reductase
MGGTVLRVLPEFPQLQLTGALAARADTAPALPVPLSRDPAQALAGARVAVDFTLAAAVAGNARACAAAGVALVCGVTGLGEAEQDALEAAAQHVPVLWSPNMSLGIAVLRRISALAAAGLGPGFDAAVFELHHRGKRDAPSGTALALAADLDTARGAAPGTTPVASLRAGDVAGEHTVVLAGTGERLELVHRATDRTIFARGALRAAAWLAGRPPGRYALSDLLGLKDLHA